MSASVESLTKHFIDKLRNHAANPKFLFSEPTWQSLTGLIASGVDPNTTAPYYGYTLLHLCIMAKAYDKIDHLLSFGVINNVRDIDGYTPLHLALDQDPVNFDAAIKLLQGGAYPDITDKEGRTLLHLAASSGNQSYISAAFQAGIDPERTCNQGYKAFSYLKTPSLHPFFKESEKLTSSLRKHLALERQQKEQERYGSLFVFFKTNPATRHDDSHLDSLRKKPFWEGCSEASFNNIFSLD